MLDKILDKKWTKILETFGGGGKGGMPLAVTQEDCLVPIGIVSMKFPECYKVNNDSFIEFY